VSSRDIGSIGGHIAPSRKLLEVVTGHIQRHGQGLLADSYVSHTGDDIAILMTHTRGVKHEAIHRLAWDAFVAGTALAKQQGLYGAGQDLLKDAFTGNVHGMGPAVAEMEFEERPTSRSCSSPPTRPTPVRITFRCIWVSPMP
jgi:fructose 1,6-bisphosphate aldolase/phosphatase